MGEQVESCTVKHSALCNWPVVDGGDLAGESCYLDIDFGSGEMSAKNKLI